MRRQPVITMRKSQVEGSHLELQPWSRENKQEMVPVSKILNLIPRDILLLTRPGLLHMLKECYLLRIKYLNICTSGDGHSHSNHHNGLPALLKISRHTTNHQEKAELQDHPLAFDRHPFWALAHLFNPFILVIKQHCHQRTPLYPWRLCKFPSGLSSEIRSLSRAQWAPFSVSCVLGTRLFILLTR